MPTFIDQIRFPRTLMSWRKKVIRPANKYISTGHPLLIFEQMRPVHDAAARLMASKAIIAPDKFVNGQIEPDLQQIPNSLRDIAERLNTQTDNEIALIEFLAIGLGSVALAGPDGLKNRSGLLESRYDTI
ncbi:hypothetical protein HED60_12605 [Planctomycetales bacterium ZRK34]|nr:hypothetical protein HED60_12605 [Planctomycetales bacterium ZRK34]